MRMLFFFVLTWAFVGSAFGNEKTSPKRYTCISNVTFLKNGKDVNSSQQELTFDLAKYDNSKKFSVTHTYDGKKFAIEYRPQETYGIYMDFLVTKTLSLSGLSWTTTAPTIQKADKNNVIHEPEIISPFKIEDGPRDIGDEIQAKTQIDCHRNK